MTFCYNNNSLIKPSITYIHKMLDWICKLFQSNQIIFLLQDLRKTVGDFWIIG